MRQGLFPVDTWVADINFGSADDRQLKKITNEANGNTALDLVAAFRVRLHLFAQFSQIINTSK
jgi:hypothetical protein